MKRIIRPSKLMLAGALAASVIAVAASVGLTLIFSSDYHILYVPFASWYVLALNGLIVALAGVILFGWYCLRSTQKDLDATDRELTDLKRQPLEDEIPAVGGYKQLDHAELLPVVQMLFRHPLDAKHIRVEPLPGGYGGNTTLLAQLQRGGDGAPLPRSFVVKLGQKRDMADEYDKFQQHVRWHLPRAARFFRHAEWGDFAGIAYEFVGLDPDHEIFSLYQFYRGYAAVEVSDLIQEVYSHLERAWYRGGEIASSNLYHEYSLLSKKQKAIIEQVAELVDESDPYRLNFSVVEEKLQPNLKPGFCPGMDIPWHDPVAFLRTWPRHSLSLPIHRSVVHGDLHSRNVLIEISRTGQKHAWFIDFSHSGNGLSQARTREALSQGSAIDVDRGHTLRDFTRLEADVKFILTQLQNEGDLQLALAFEKELMTGGLALTDPPPVEALTDERFRKAWQVVKEIRRRAAAYLSNPDDLRPYFLGLLQATLPVVYYHPGQFADEEYERQQKRYALIAAGMLCSQL